MLFYMFANLFGCSDVKNPDSIDENEELITELRLFLLDNEGNEIAYVWQDPIWHGSVNEPLLLQSATSYQVRIEFWNALSEPTENVTVEIAEEAAEHQVFYLGEAMDQSYLNIIVDDSDTNGLPLGLQTSWETLGTGASILQIGLRHFPEEDGMNVKTGEFSEDMDGSWDVFVDISLEIQ